MSQAVLGARAMFRVGVWGAGTACQEALPQTFGGGTAGWPGLSFQGASPLGRQGT